MFYRAALFVFLLTPLYALAVEPTPESWNTDGAGKAYLLYRGQNIQPLTQGASPSCTGCAMAKALEIMHPGVKFSPEWLYGIARAESNSLGPIPGATVEWLARAAQDVGVVPAALYPVLGNDFTKYSVQRANAYGIRGPPEELRVIAGLYKTQGYHKISTWEQLRGAIANGYPVIIGSSLGFGPKRGQVRAADGSLSLRWWSRWRHAMVCIGVSDQGKHRGALILNSWGSSWVTGPKRFSDEVEGSFWAKKADVTRMINQGDTWVVLPIKGALIR